MVLIWKHLLAVFGVFIFSSKMNISVKKYIHEPYKSQFWTSWKLMTHWDPYLKSDFKVIIKAAKYSFDKAFAGFEIICSKNRDYVCIHHTQNVSIFIENERVVSYIKNIYLIICIINHRQSHRKLITNELRHNKTNKVSVRPAKTQFSLGVRPVWSESSLSAWRKLGFLSYPLSTQWRLWSDWAGAQADLSPHWAHTHFVGFVMWWLNYKFYICILALVVVDVRWKRH